MFSEKVVLRAASIVLPYYHVNKFHGFEVYVVKCKGYETTIVSLKQSDCDIYQAYTSIDLKYMQIYDGTSLDLLKCDKSMVSVSCHPCSKSDIELVR
mgnify:CR=1 FL=1